MVERREHKRYAMPRGTLAILRNEAHRLQEHANMNIGEIAMIIYKSSPEIIGQVTDMSFSGVAFEGKSIDQVNTDNVELDLLMAEEGLYLYNLPFTTVASSESGKGRRRAAAARPNALQFTNLDDRQKDQIREMLSHRIG